jgi:hypothetical protein
MVIGRQDDNLTYPKALNSGLTKSKLVLIDQQIRWASNIGANSAPN